jgi:single-strand DNA-binding protein
MNKVQLVGRITKDIELRQTSNQTAYCNFTLAVDRRFKDANGNKQTDFISCVAWKQTAEFINKYFDKGSRIGVCGSIQTRSYEKDGQKVFVTEVVVDEAEFVESTAKGEASAPSRITNANEAIDRYNQNNVSRDTDIGKLPFEL